MTSKIVVNNIGSDTGINSVTFDSNIQRGDSNLHSTGLNVDNTFVHSTGIALGAGSTIGAVTGVTTYYGDGSQLTGIDATQIATGNTKIQTAASRVDTKVDNVGILTVTAAGANVTGIITATAFVGSIPLSHRNIIINGAMRVAQRASSSTANGYGDLDRWKHEYAGTNENPTFAQVSLTTSDTPYTLGLTKAVKITNGNQTSGLQASSQINFNQQIEAQDIRNSGWNYTSSSSYITLSFWVRSSVSQNFNGFVKTADGSMYIYPYETGTLSANTWTKITKSIPGNSNLTINDDNGSGLQVFAIAIYGTNMTDNSVTYNQWAGWASGSRSKDQANSWFTTNDATLEITGVQLEVGPVATPFEHRSMGEELLRCKRYYQRGYDYHHLNAQNGESDRWIRFQVEMRSGPTVTTAPTNSVSFAPQSQTVNGFAGNGSGNSHANFNLEWTASAEI